MSFPCFTVTAGIGLFIIFCCFPHVVLLARVIKGERGAEVTLVCIPPRSTVAHPTIFWEKKETTLRNIASSVAGIPHISDVTLKSRAVLNDGNLTISSLTIADGGLYICTVTPIQSSPLLYKIELVVTAVPQIKVFINPNPKLEPNGTYVAATCVAKSGKPRPTLQWTNNAQQEQKMEESVSLLKDGSWTVRSQLVLQPGLFGRSDDSTNPISMKEKMQIFICHVSYERLKVDQTRKRILIEALYAPVTHISLLGNRMTCHVEGKPRPSLSWVLPNGNILANMSSLYLGRAERGNGRYSCRGSSPIKPDSIDTLDVQRAEDLPVLFRTVEKLETSLPITAAGYQLTCSAQVEKTQNIDSISFEWRKNNKKIDPEVYEVTSNYSTHDSSSRYSKLESTLLFLDVVSGRDDALFQCRLVNRSALNAFVTAVERSVNISVDYPPSRAFIKGSPEDFVVLEGASLTLDCTSNAKPDGQIEWYFKGFKIATGKSITIKGILKEEAGMYKCVAFNYISGSAFAVAKVTVIYPPKEAIIEKIRGRLKCRADGGSVPPPLFSWIYPNNSYYRKNVTEINLLDPPTEGELRYACLISNNLGVTVNTTFLQHAPISKRIGSLTVASFVVILVLICSVSIAGFIFGLWILSRRNQSKESSTEVNCQRYFHYEASPKTSKNSSEGYLSPEQCTNTNSSSPHSNNFINEVKEGVCENRTDVERSLHCAENPTLNQSSVAYPPPQSCVQSIRDLASPQSHSTKQFQSFSDVEAPSIEITAINSLRSSTANPSDGSTTVVEKNHKSTEELATPCENTEETDDRNDNDLKQDDLESTTSGTYNLKNDCITNEQQTLFPVQYIQQNTFPKNYFSRMHFNFNRPHPLGVVVSPYDPILFDPNWHPAVAGPESRLTSNIPSRQFQFSPNFISRDKLPFYLKNESETSVTTLKRRRSRSISLSEPQPGGSHSKQSANNVIDNKPSIVNGIFVDQLNQGENQLVCSSVVNRKYQSLTLV